MKMTYNLSGYFWFQTPFKLDDSDVLKAVAFNSYS